MSIPTFQATQRGWLTAFERDLEKLFAEADADHRLLGEAIEVLSRIAHA